MTTLEQLATHRTPRRDVEAHKANIRAQVRAYRLRELREQFDITQTSMAAQLNISQDRVSTIERGNLDKTQIETLRRYVEALGGTLNLEVQIGDKTFTIA